MELTDGVCCFGGAQASRLIVTNQVAIGKGLLTVDGLAKVQERLDDLLDAEGTSIDGWYFCPKTR